MRTVMTIACEPTGEFRYYDQEGEMKGFVVRFPYPPGTRHRVVVPEPYQADAGEDMQLPTDRD
jgi:hypothetical protein